MPLLDRFRPPTAADEKAYCQCCQRKLHHEELNENGLCEECAPDEEECNEKD